MHKNSASNVLLHLRIYFKMDVWFVTKADSLVLRLEMLLDKAVLESRLLGLGLVWSQHLLTSIRALWYRKKSTVNMMS